MGKILTFIGGAFAGIIGLTATALLAGKFSRSGADVSSIPDNEGHIEEPPESTPKTSIFDE